MRRSRLLVAMFQGGGNVPLLLPIVTRLATLGYPVRCMISPGVRSSRLPIGDHLCRSLRATGGDVIGVRAPEIHPLDVAPGTRGVVAGWVPKSFRAVTAEALAARWIPQWAHEVASVLAHEPADAVITDFVLVGALVAAERARVPSVALVHTVYPRPVRGRPPYGPGWRPAVGIAGHLRDAVGASVSNRIQARDALPFLNLARRRLGLRPLRRYFEQYDGASRVVVLTSPKFDPPAGLPSNVRFVGTPLGEDVSPSPLATACQNDGRPLVLVSLSTLDQGQATLMESILVALGSLPVRALVTLGPALGAARFTAPPNVMLESFVPHGSVLPRATAIITQCGLGTVMKALAHGVPLVCIPLVDDPADNAAPVAALGAGVRLPSDAEPSRIREAIERVLTEPGFRLGARRIAKATAEEKPVGGEVAEVESGARGV